jgi:GAF domain-containing protein
MPSSPKSSSQWGKLKGWSSRAKGDRWQERQQAGSLSTGNLFWKLTGLKLTPTFAAVKAAGFRTRLAVPIEAGGRVIAALVFHSREPNAYSEEDVQRLQPILPIIALLLQRLMEQWQLEQTLERERKIRQQLELIAHIDNLLISGEPMPKVLQGFAEAIRPFVPFDRLSISVYDEPTNREWLYVVWHDGLVWEAKRVKPHEPFGAAKQVMKTGKPLLRPRLDAAEFPAEAWLIERGFRSALVYPLPMRERFKATLNFSSREPEAFNEQHIEFLNSLSDQIAIALHSFLPMKWRKSTKGFALDSFNLVPICWRLVPLMMSSLSSIQGF